MPSMPMRAAVIALAVLAVPALGLAADRNIESAILLAALAAILGAATAAIVLADIMARPLVEIARAVRDLAPGEVRATGCEDDERRDDVIAREQCARRISIVIGAAQAAPRPHPPDAIASAKPAAARRYRFVPAPTLGNLVDMLVPPDDRERHLDERARGIKGGRAAQ